MTLSLEDIAVYLQDKIETEDNGEHIILKDEKVLFIIHFISLN